MEHCELLLRWEPGKNYDPSPKWNPIKECVSLQYLENIRTNAKLFSIETHQGNYKLFSEWDPETIYESYQINELHINIVNIFEYEFVQIFEYELMLHDKYHA